MLLLLGPYRLSANTEGFVACDRSIVAVIGLNIHMIHSNSHGERTDCFAPSMTRGHTSLYSGLLVGSSKIHSRRAHRMATIACPVRGENYSERGRDDSEPICEWTSKSRSALGRRRRATPKVDARLQAKNRFGGRAPSFTGTKSNSASPMSSARPFQKCIFAGKKCCLSRG